MSGLTAQKLAVQMTIHQSLVKRGLMDSHEALSHFMGYVHALADTGFIDSSESCIFIDEFASMII